MCTRSSVKFFRGFNRLHVTCSIFQLKWKVRSSYLHVEVWIPVADQSDDEQEQENVEEQSGVSEEENEGDDSGQIESDGDHQEEGEEEEVESAHDNTGNNHF